MLSLDTHLRGYQNILCEFDATLFSGSGMPRPCRANSFAKSKLSIFYWADAYNELLATNTMEDEYTNIVWVGRTHRIQSVPIDTMSACFGSNQTSPITQSPSSARVKNLS